ncbi:MAG: hypothetical protein CVV64_20135 [Candidatus Wallbacteria bacterium HGW-Wallbacteria-1]|jgi:hypothetical protein|uniref:Protein NO VEIN C-terminal domain-containing protein n=1 Tax=Candidatus Wallbacteria bacterium HGW-Wallbacteria-1 TaxID=2013854 RepID=A0A2N1PIH4_9BACT|nr:MAG: hypothetical protein CVV64_20135 [Candidatus Wallbacteria bacterium HGW-Wallbacteria-1]
MSDPWSELENKLIIEDYFHMLEDELMGQTYNKAQHRRDLTPRLNNRSKASIEIKHQNISAALIDLGIPYIDGYKPMKNYQQKLPMLIMDFLRNNNRLFDLFSRDTEFTPNINPIVELLNCLEEPPKGLLSGSISSPKPATQTTIWNTPSFNYVAQEAQNSALGASGEEFVIEYERKRLNAIGMDNYISRIEQISETQGPWAGYDIRSIDKSKRDMFIEVKTTKYGKETPFYLTSNEKTFSENNNSNYYLYRLFNFRVKPGLFVLNGNITQHFQLKPIVYKCFDP